LSTIGVRHLWEFALYVAAVLCFLATITISIYVYDRNSKHLENVLRGSESRDFILERCDKLSKFFFIIAVFFAFLMGAVAAYGKYKDSTEKGIVKMCDEQKANIVHCEERSLSGIDELRPSKPQDPPDAPKKDESKDEDNKKPSKNSD
jgi:hypothetical protein